MAPTYHKPLMPIPEHFKETGTWVPAKTISPPTEVIPWWQTFKDPLLNRLEQQLEPSNQNLKELFFRYEEARALVQVAKSGFFPFDQGIIDINRQQSSKNVANRVAVPLFNNIAIANNLDYELDVWGSIRNSVALNQNLAKASAEDLATLSLSLHAELAADYFTLRGYDETQRILNNTVKAYTKALYLTQQRYQGGASPAQDVDYAKNQLENAKTMATDMRLKRSQLEHAIAILLGQIPSNFSLHPAKLATHVISVAPYLPSTLLERRPDIAAAESRVKAANANIGIARAAFFPVLNLTGIVGFQSDNLSNLISKPSLFWSLGPLSILAATQSSAIMTLFDGGRLLGLLKQAKANYYETVASYRQTVLTAFQQVEDNLVAIKRLDQEYLSQTAATNAAKKALIQAEYRYRGGIITFLDVVVTKNLALQAELAQVQVLTRRQLASIQLIKALGGGWVCEESSKHSQPPPKAL